jgi:hypothetical protein
MSPDTIRRYAESIAASLRAFTGPSITGEGTVPADNDEREATIRDIVRSALRILEVDGLGGCELCCS